MTYKINMDTKRYYNKPKSYQFSQINNTTARNIEELTLEEFAIETGEKGRAFTRALLKNGRKEENFIQQDFLVLDFDNTLPYKDFINRCKEYGMMPVFTYRTYNWSRLEDRFRAVFLMNITITDLRFARAMNYILQSLFPEADSACNDIPRLFLGGKKLIETDLDARIEVLEVVYAAQDYMKKTKKSNYARDLKALGKNAGVKVQNSMLCIYGPGEECSNDTSELIRQGDYVMIYADGNDGEEPVSDKKIYARRKDIKVIGGYTQDALEKICPLLKDHRETELPHEQKFMLATNMVYISGGEQIFMSSLKKNKTKWKNDIRRDIKGKSYVPQRCAKGKCPYRENCKTDSLYGKLSRKIMRIEVEKDYFPIEAASAALKSVLTEIMKKEDELIHIIRGQTALGKTEVYCNLVRENADKKFLIAVPTIVLQNEVADRLRAKGVECYKTVGIYQGLLNLQIPGLTELLEELNEKGMGKYIRRAVQNFIGEHIEELEITQIQEIKKVLSARVTADARCIVTTHALLLLMMESSIYADYEVIVDEDILMSIFKSNYTIPLEDIETAIKSGIFGSGTVARLYEILRMQDEETAKTGLNKLSTGQAELLCKNRTMFQGALPLLFESSVLGMDKKKQAVLFFVEKKMPDHKMIIVSASADKNLYIDYLKDRTRVDYCEIPMVKYKGELLQYSMHTMSREYINNYGKEKILEGIKWITGDCPCISFKMLGADAITHFGNTEGLDIYAGKNISVLGTPHCIPLIYKVFGEYFGYANSENLSPHRIERNGYSFKFMTYGDEKMRNLQLFFIETELEQAVGRARLLRFPCKVYLFSNYPCTQAKIIQDEYLKANTGSEK